MVKKDLNISLAIKMLKNRQNIEKYRKNIDETKYMSFLIEDDELLKNYNKILRRLKIVLIKNLIVIVYTTKKI